MRVLLQNTESKLYYVDTNQWTDDPSKARDFVEVELAEEIYHAQNLAYAQIVTEPEAQGRKPELLGELLRCVQARG